jgi:hypothetical protein
MIKLPSFVKLSSVLSPWQLQFLKWGLETLIVNSTILIPQTVEESVKREMVTFYTELLQLVKQEVR